MEGFFWEEKSRILAQYQTDVERKRKRRKRKRYKKEKKLEFNKIKIKFGLQHPEDLSHSAYNMQRLKIKQNQFAMSKVFKIN